ncbi:hypothetical protein QR680_015661 [Steinernema hermaphroditum]|uniref:7TM GPCR serpentine receptor class x (Srx) domain-containing protein n=1 Tax=Steinernema hermaphroditum TaxID=289476 RepID=A0AA39LL03_9BILA|nr:hypothetical protein QR680_015661 [Steinernema hermaphroditum]
MNTSREFASQLLGRGHSTKNDLIIGWTTIMLCCSQIVFGTCSLYLLKKISIFHNAFGFLCAARTMVEMMSSVLHATYSGPATILQVATSFITLACSQIQDMSPYIGIFVGATGYFLSGMSCSLHVLLSLNRLTALYFVFHYKRIFSARNCRCIIYALIVAVFLLVVPYYVVPCNVLGFSVAHFGYIVVGCPDGTQPMFNVGTVSTYICWAAFCAGTIIVDTLTLIRIIKVKRMASNEVNRNFQRNVRFFAQSSFQNFPMLIDIALLTFGNNEISENKAVFRVLSFILTRFTDLINSTTLILFNPEARRYIITMTVGRNLVSFTESSTGVHMDTVTRNIRHIHNAS